MNFERVGASIALAVFGLFFVFVGVSVIWTFLMAGLVVLV